MESSWLDEQLIGQRSFRFSKPFLYLIKLLLVEMWLELEKSEA